MPRTRLGVKVAVASLSAIGGLLAAGAGQTSHLAGGVPARGPVRVAGMMAAADADPAGAPPMPSYVPPGFVRDFTETFSVPATDGTFPAGSAAYARKWDPGYDGMADTSGLGTYDSSRVLSVQNGELIWDMHSENGHPLVAVPLPKNDAGNDYRNFTYGEVGMAIRVPKAAPGYKIAFLLWPQTDKWTNEVDFPEVDSFTSPVKAVSLLTGGHDGFVGPTDTGANLADGMYHTFLLDWQPGTIRAFVDGRLVATGHGDAVPTQPMHVVLQGETWIGSGGVPSNAQAIVEMPWFFINRWAPGNNG